MDCYNIGKAIPKVGLHVVNEHSQERLNYEIKIIGVKPPNDFIRIVRSPYKSAGQQKSPGNVNGSISGVF